MSTLIAQVVRIDAIEIHPDADSLDLLTIKGWTVVEKKGRFKLGDSVIFFPPDAILPKDLSDKIGCTQYLSKQRIKPARLRGIVSCGLVAPNYEGWEVGTDVTEHYQIKKYEPPEPGNNSGLGGQNIKDVGPFNKYTDIENWNNYPDILIEDEEVVIVEKVHGSNWRAALVDDEFYVGSHYKIKAKDEKIAYWQVALRYNIEQLMRECLPEARCWALYGEVLGVQDLKYDLSEPDLRLFDIACNGVYLNYDEFESIMEKLKLPMVPLLYRGPYNAELLSKLSTGQAFQGNHMKEGTVIRPTAERYHRRLGRVILKKINPDYLVRKGNTTEYH